MGCFMLLENPRDEISKVMLLRLLQVSAVRESTLRFWAYVLSLWKAAIGFQGTGTVLEKKVHVYVNSTFIFVSGFIQRKHF